MLGLTVVITYCDKVAQHYILDNCSGWVYLLKENAMK